MQQVTCMCGSVFEAPDIEGMFAVMRAHTDEAHAEYELRDDDVRDFVEAALRMEPPLPRVEAIGEVEVQPLAPERADDFMRFFDYEGFRDNPAWAGCYCRFFYQADAGVWKTRRLSENRDEAERCSRRGEMPGYLAYVDGEVGGWCNAAPRSTLPRVLDELGIVGDTDAAVGSVVCFVIAPHLRRHGLSGRLLDAAIDGFRGAGMRYVEGYPNKESHEGASENFRGPEELFRRAGFEAAGETERTKVMRLRL